jgi:hypothetical protein
MASTKSVLRRANQVGMPIKKTRNGWVIGELGHDDTFFLGQRSRRNRHSERRIDSRLRKREKGGLD